MNQELLEKHLKNGAVAIDEKGQIWCDMYTTITDEKLLKAIMKPCKFKRIFIVPKKDKGFMAIPSLN